MSGESSGVNPLVAIRYLNASPSNRDSTGTVNPLARVPAGTEIEGFVINRTSNLQPILRTSIGDILVESELFLKTGSEVTIRVDPNVAGRARIVKVDGLTPQEYVKTTGERPAITSNPTSVTGNSAIAAKPSAPPQIIQALFVPTSPSSPTPALPAHILSPSVQLPSGQHFSPEAEWVGQLRTLLQQRPSLEIQMLARAMPSSPINAFTNIPALPTPSNILPTTSPPPHSSGTTGISPHPTISPAPPVPTASPALPTAPSPATTAPISSSPTATPLPPASATTPPANISNPATSTTAAPPSQGRTDGNTAPPVSTTAPNAPVQLQRPANAPDITPAALEKALTGTVIRAEANKPVVVQTAIGQIQLLNTRPIPAGSTVLFTVHVSQTITPPTNAPLLPASLAPVAPLMQEWETMEEIIQLLQTAYPQAAHSLLGNLPQAGPKLSAGMVFLLNVLKGGSVRELLGNAAHTPLESQHSGLLKKLSSEWASIQNVSREPVSQEWNMLLLPIWNDEHVEQIRLFIREDSQHNPSDDDASQRFIMEVGLSELGEIQLDGFLHGKKPNIQFDMILRTEHEWPEDVRKTIKGIFINTLETLGMKGGLNTQTGRQHFIRPLAADDPDPTHRMSHTDGVIA